MLGKLRLLCERALCFVTSGGNAWQVIFHLEEGHERF